MISFENVTYTYPGAERPAIRDVFLTIDDGQFALLVGPSGCGKSTLLRCINGLIPHFSGGVLHGRIDVGGINPVQATPQLMSQHVGFVFQDPEAQFVVDRVEDEIAFGLENAAIPESEMRSRVNDLLELLNLTALRHRYLETLSSGERQRVAIASALVMQPGILLLDEPTSQLDPSSAEQVLESLERLKITLKLTILLAEHRLERILPFTDQVIYMDPESHAAFTGPAREVMQNISVNPPLVRVAKKFAWHPLPLTVEEGLGFSEKLTTSPPPVEKFIPSEDRKPTSMPEKSPPFIQVINLSVRISQQEILTGINLNLYANEILVMMGANGAGKTTLLRSIVGLQPYHSGQVLVDGGDIDGVSVAEICQQIGYLPQNPNTLLFAETVQEELLITLRNHNIPVQSTDPPALLQRLGLAELSDAYPRDLSAGERQRVALGAITITHPAALLLDEPTRGLDYKAKQDLIKILKTWRDNGMAILLVTHDVEMAAETADRLVLIDKGRITDTGKPAEIMHRNVRFSPQVAKLFPDTDWLTPDDVKIIP